MAATKGGPWCRARCCFEAGPPLPVRVCLTRRGPRHGSAANAAPGAGQRRCCRLAPIAAVFQVSDGLQAAVAGALRGMGRQRLVAGLNLVGFWVIGTTVGAPGRRRWRGQCPPLQCTPLSAQTPGTLLPHFRFRVRGNVDAPPLSGWGQPLLWARAPRRQRPLVKKNTWHSRSRPAATPAAPIHPFPGS